MDAWEVMAAIMKLRPGLVPIETASEKRTREREIERLTQQLVDLGPEVVGYLLPLLDEDVYYPSYRAVLARQILKRIVDTNPMDAIAPQLAEAAHRPYIAELIITRDVARAVAMGLYRDPQLRPLVIEGLRCVVEPQRFVGYLADPDPDLRLLAYECDVALNLVGTRHAPLELARRHLEDPALRAYAAHVLLAAKQAEDAELVLAACDTFSLDDETIAWLAALPGAAALAPQLALRPLAELVRRRRCAGLAPLDFDTRPVLAAGLADPSYPTSIAAACAAASLAAEVRDPAMVTAVLQRGHQIGYRVIPAFVDMLAVLSEDKVHAEFAALPEGAYRDELRAAYRDRQPISIEIADQAFELGAIDGPVHERDKAYRIYAQHLFEQPDHTHAALQLAVIDHTYAVPIDARRIEWLRELGVRDEDLLTDLAVPEPAIGPRLHQPDLHPTVQRTHAIRWRARALAQLDRVRAACR
ncbi:MAG: hypothetical protein ABI867_32865 [Kofleriaceae bacterium]